MSFELPPGRHVAADSVCGYYIDLSEKAKEPAWPPPWIDRPHPQVGLIQWGLGCYERYLGGEGDGWLDAALGAGEHLLATQQVEGRFSGGWLHREPFPHTYALKPPWLSAMAQGEGASLLVRLHAETADERYAEAARHALHPLSKVPSEGGVAAPLNGGLLPEEYPTDPPSRVLNGAIFALWGYRDVALALGDEGALEAFESGVGVLSSAIELWDNGYWSMYDLFPHPLPNVASPAYHALHVTQLRALTQMCPLPPLLATLERFERYAASRASRARALTAKVAFRIAVPRRKIRGTRG